jgi:hypothetical protein
VIRVVLPVCPVGPVLDGHVVGRGGRPDVVETKEIVRVAGGLDLGQPAAVAAEGRFLDPRIQLMTGA